MFGVFSTFVEIEYDCILHVEVNGFVYACTFAYTFINLTYVIYIYIYIYDAVSLCINRQKSIFTKLRVL